MPKPSAASFANNGEPSRTAVQLGLLACIMSEFRMDMAQTSVIIAIVKQSVLTAAPGLYDYAVTHSAAQDPLLTQLAAETAATFPDFEGMQIGSEIGTVISLLTQISGAKYGLEIGTFTGYSSICLARALAEGGKLICCDVSDEWTSMARKYWHLADVADRIELRIGPGEETLLAMPKVELFDIAFLDADKVGYIGYWEEIVPRLRPGGVILVDNTLAQGRVIDKDATSETVEAIRSFNEHVHTDLRMTAILLPIGDGLTFARKRG